MKLHRFIETADVEELHEMISIAKKEIKRRQEKHVHLVHCRRAVKALVETNMEDETIIFLLVPCFTPNAVTSTIEEIRNN